MSTSASTFVAPIMPSVVQPMIERSYYVENQFFKIFGQPKKYVGSGSAVTWGVNVGESSSNATTVSEHGVLPDVNDSAYCSLTKSLETYSVVGEISDEAVAYGIGAMSEVITDRTNELVNEIASSLISDIEGTCISTGAIQGQTVTNYTAALVSGYEATDTAITEDYLNAALQHLLSGSFSDGGRPAVPREKLAIITNTDMYFLMASVLTPAAGNPWVQSGPGFDGGLAFFKGAPLTFNGIPIFLHEGVTTGTVLMGDRSLIETYEAIPMQMKPLARNNNATKFEIMWNGCVINKRPSAWYRLVNKD